MDTRIAYLTRGTETHVPTLHDAPPHAWRIPVALTGLSPHSSMTASVAHLASNISQYAGRFGINVRFVIDTDTNRVIVTEGRKELRALFKQSGQRIAQVTLDGEESLSLGMLHDLDICFGAILD